MRHLQGQDRLQSSLLPDALEDYVAPDDSVRVIDAFVDTLNFEELGFSKATTSSTGRKPYHPGDLLKLYIYGYLTRIHTSRRLEQECHRNLEVLWLMRRLAPDFKTIADFRKDNGSAIRGACRAFIMFCRSAGLINGRLVGIDGSRFKAAASKDRALTRRQLLRDRKLIDSKIEGYLAQLETQDAEETVDEVARDRVRDALNRLKARSHRLNEYECAMDELGSNQYCETEPDARIMRSGRDGMILGYNVQSAVDADSGLIVHHQVTQDATDSRQLLPMAEKTKSLLGSDTLDVVADTGYSNAEHLDACERQGINATVPRSPIPGTDKELFQKSEFNYDPEADCYTCPAGELLPYRRDDLRRNLKIYVKKGCSRCALQAKCAKSDQRTLSRSHFEGAIARSNARLSSNPNIMTQRMAIAERPFAVLKQAMGLRRFVCRGMQRTEAELSIAILGYNLRRTMNIASVPGMLALLR